MQSPQDVGSTFSRSWELLSNNWNLIVPGIVIAVVAGIVLGFIGFTSLGAAVSLSAVGLAGAGLSSILLAAFVSAIIGALAFVITICYTTGMAAAAWETGTATYADGSRAFSTEGGNVVVAAILYFVLSVIAFALAPFTLFFSVLAFWVFFLYTFPAAIVGGVPGAQALGESCRIVMRNFGSTIVLVVLLAIAMFAGGIVGGIFGHVPFLGRIIQLVIQMVVTAYVTIVIVGEYLKVRATANVTAAPPGTGAAF